MASSLSINAARRVTSNLWTDEEAFDPEEVDWDKLIELYRDDPALTFIFGQLQEYFQRQVPGYTYTDRSLRWDTNSTVGDSTNGPGLYLYGDTTTPMKISDPVTVTWDNNGTLTLKRDEE